MAPKLILLTLAVACFVQTISSQYINAPIADDLLASRGYGLLGPYNYGGFGPVAPTNGGGFAVTSASAITPTGITVASENAIEGVLAVSGQLPFLGAIALEGVLPTVGAGAIDYGCGNGNVAMVSEGLGAVGPYGVGYGQGMPPMAYYPSMNGGLY